MKEENDKIKFDSDFWTKQRPHVVRKEKDEDMIPFKWSGNVLSGKKKAILTLANNKNN